MTEDASASRASQPQATTLVTQLQLRDFTLVGFSIRGGEVARYLGKYGSRGVSKAVIISSMPPYLLKTAENPDGVDASAFDGIQKAVAADRYPRAKRPPSIPISTQSTTRCRDAAYLDLFRSPDCFR
jgi:pimeloyl-ACP methyl ester carboxylesterase